MASAIGKAITELEQEVEALDQRRGELQRTIETLRGLCAETDVERRGPVTRGRTARGDGEGVTAREDLIRAIGVRAGSKWALPGTPRAKEEP